MESHRWIGAIAVIVLTRLLLVATAPGIPIVWDEGEYMSRASLTSGANHGVQPGDAHPFPAADDFRPSAG